MSINNKDKAYSVYGIGIIGASTMKINSTMQTTTSVMLSKSNETNFKQSLKLFLYDHF